MGKAGKSNTPNGMPLCQTEPAIPEEKERWDPGLVSWGGRKKKKKRYEKSEWRKQSYAEKTLSEPSTEGSRRHAIAGAGTPDTRNLARERGGKGDQSLKRMPQKSFTRHQQMLWGQETILIL